MTRYLKVLLVAFVAVWIWAAINPSDRHDWLLESYLVFIFVPVIIVTGRYFRLKYQPGFWSEMKASFKIEAGDAPLGEKRLREMRKTR